jgi:hypothetical protein
MNKKLIIISIILSVMLLVSGCAGPGAKPKPYEYVHTTELNKYEIYETERIRDAERSVVLTLEQLGYGELALAGGEEEETTTVEYTLPDGTTQGPDTWYLINFHFIIEFEEATGGGFCDVQAKPGASVQFETMKVNDSPYIRISGEDAASTSTRIEVRYYNYLSLRGVRPGKNEMRFTYKEYQGAKVKSMTVYNDTAIEVTSMAPSAYDEELKLSPGEQERAREIAFSDPRVQELAEGKEYATRITRADGLVRPADEPPDDDIEVRLVFAENYMIEDIEASALDVFVDLNEGAVTYIFPLGPSGMPELTANARERAVNIALSDADVQKLLEGKEYTITRIGPSQGGPVGRLGANMDIAFDKAYPFQGDFPYFPEERNYLDKAIEGIEAFVNLKEERVVQIWPDIAPEVP